MPCFNLAKLGDNIWPWLSNVELEAESWLSLMAPDSIPRDVKPLHPRKNKEDSHFDVGQGRAGQGRAGQGRAGQGRAGQGRAGQGRAGQGRAGQSFKLENLQYQLDIIYYIL